MEALLQSGINTYQAFAAAIEFDESLTELDQQVSQSCTFCYTVIPENLYARPEMLEYAIALSLDAQVFWILDRMSPDYAQRHDVYVRSQLQSIEHGNLPLFLQLLDRGAAEGVDSRGRTVVTIPPELEEQWTEGGISRVYKGDFWRKRPHARHFLTEQGNKPLYLVCAAAMEFELFEYLYEASTSTLTAAALAEILVYFLQESMSDLTHSLDDSPMWSGRSEKLPSAELIVERLEACYQAGRVRKQANRLTFFEYFNTGSCIASQISTPCLTN
jgi:hypothetical protein